MHAQVDQRPAASLLLAHEPAAQPRNAGAAHPVRLGVVDLADRARVDILLDPLHIVTIAFIEADYQDAPVLLRSRQDLPALVGVARQRLLAQHMLAGL